MLLLGVPASPELGLGVASWFGEIAPAVVVDVLPGMSVSEGNTLVITYFIFDLPVSAVSFFFGATFVPERFEAALAALLYYIWRFARFALMPNIFLKALVSTFFALICRICLDKSYSGVGPPSYRDGRQFSLYIIR